MKKRNIVIVSIVAALALAAVPFVYAGPGGFHHRGAMGHGGPGAAFGAGMLFGHLQHIAEELDLSDAQVDQIKAIFAETHQQNEQYHEQLAGGMHDAVLTLINNPNDLAAAQAALDRQAAAEKAMKQNVLTATSKALNVLTAAQRTELAQIVQEHSERRAERRRR